MDVALAVIGLLIVAVGFTIRQFGKVHRLAGWLLVPYLLWVGYASYLNAGFLLLNT
jgi:tryptophan-rich sensory protein